MFFPKNKRCCTRKNVLTQIKKKSKNVKVCCKKEESVLTMHKPRQSSGAILRTLSKCFKKFTD